MISETIEHWDDIGFTVIFTQEFKYSIRFLVYEIAATEITGPDGFKADRGWMDKDGNSNIDLVFDPHLAERCLTGSIKWDGCSHLTFGSEDNEGYMHLCGADGIRQMNDLLLRLFRRCGDLLGDKALEGVFTR